MHRELIAFSPHLICPCCGQRRISACGEALICQGCGRSYSLMQGIPVLCDSETARIGFAADLKELSRHTAGDHEVTEANALYYNYAAAKCDETTPVVGVITPQGKQRILECLRHLRASGVTGPLLDFGTGTGQLLELAEGLFEPRLGIDISSGMLKRAIRQGNPVVLADGNNPPIADASIGVVLAYSFLHHFKNPMKVLDQMIRILRPGGWIFVDWEPNKFGQPRLLSRIIAKLKHPELWIRSLTWKKPPQVQKLHRLAEYHQACVHGIDADILARHLANHGCDTVRLLYHSNCPSALQPKFRIADRTRALLDGRLPTDKSSSLMFLLMARRAGA